MKVQDRQPTLDPRYQRVRRKLLAAALSIGAQKPIDEVTVAEISAFAGTHRTSFYSHAASPTALLTDALISELVPTISERREELSSVDTDFAKYWWDFYKLVLEHALAHPHVYRNAVAADSALLPALHKFYSEQVAESLNIVAAWWQGETPTHLWLKLAGQQLASNMMALLVVWTKLDFQPSIEDLLDEYRTLVPPWQLAKRNPDGIVSMLRRLPISNR